MRPERRSQGATCSLTCTASVPLMRLSTGRCGASCCQCKVSGPSYGKVPESSMTVVLAAAGTAATNMTNSSSRPRRYMDRMGPRSRRAQRVEHPPGVSARGGQGGIAVGKGPAALGPLVLADGPDGLHGPGRKCSGRKRLCGSSAGRTVATGRPGNARERERIAGGIKQRGGYGRGHIDRARAGARGAVKTSDVQLRGDVTERVAVVGTRPHGTVRGHGLRGTVAHGGGGHADRVLVDARVVAGRAAGVVVAGEATDAHLQIDGLGGRRSD